MNRYLSSDTHGPKPPNFLQSCTHIRLIEIIHYFDSNHLFSHRTFNEHAKRLLKIPRVLSSEACWSLVRFCGAVGSRKGDSPEVQRRTAEEKQESEKENVFQTSRDFVRLSSLK